MNNRRLVELEEEGEIQSKYKWKRVLQKKSFILNLYFQNMLLSTLFLPHQREERVSAEGSSG